VLAFCASGGETVARLPSENPRHSKRRGAKRGRALTSWKIRFRFALLKHQET
jgi:hypothetical protein